VRESVAGTIVLNGKRRCRGAAPQEDWWNRWWCNSDKGSKWKIDACLPVYAMCYNIVDNVLQNNMV